MTLPLEPPLKPQLALSRKELPVGEEYVYEVKLDGFRCLAFVDGEELFLQSRNGKPLGRYFPELVLPSGRYVLDGEIVVRDADGREDFDALGQRIHPAVSRIERLAGETPAVYVAFDLLAHDDRSLLELPFSRAPRGAGGAARRQAVRRRAGRADADGRDAPGARSSGCRAPRGRSPRSARRPTGRASARAWSRSSACARSTR